MQRFNEVLVIHIQVNKLAKLQQRHPPLSLDLRPAKTSYFNHLASLPLSDSAFFFFGWITKWLRKLRRARRGLGRRTDQVVYSNEPRQQYSAYKQIGLTDDTVAALVSVSPANHLSSPVLDSRKCVALSGKLTDAFSPSLSHQSVCLPLP